MLPNVNRTIVTTGSNQLSVTRVTTFSGNDSLSSRILGSDHTFLRINAFGDFFVVVSAPNTNCPENQSQLDFTNFTLPILSTSHKFSLVQWIPTARIDCSCVSFRQRRINQISVTLHSFTPLLTVALQNLKKQCLSFKKCLPLEVLHRTPPTVARHYCCKPNR